MLVTLALPRLPMLMSSLHCRLPEKAITWGTPHCPQVHLQQPTIRPSDGLHPRAVTHYTHNSPTACIGTLSVSSQSVEEASAPALEGL